LSTYFRGIKWRYRKKADRFVLKHLERLGISLTEKQITDLTDTGFAKIEGYECHIANILAENILCVCPNHHALLDFGAIELDIRELHIHTSHPLSLQYIGYHNSIARKNSSS
jgi:predicted restriction endonuclease